MRRRAERTVLALAVCFLVACKSTQLPAPGIPLLESELNELLPKRSTKITIRAPAKKSAVFLNSEYQGDTPLSVTGLSPGLYHLRVEKPGYAPADYMIEVADGMHLHYYALLVTAENRREIQE